MPRATNNPKRLPEEVDYTFCDYGSIWLVRPENDQAQEHLENVTRDQDVPWFGGRLVVEPRYVDSLAGALEDDGFTTRIW